MYEALLIAAGFVKANSIPRVSTCYVKHVEEFNFDLDLNVSEDGSGFWAADWTDACGNTAESLSMFLASL